MVRRVCLNFLSRGCLAYPQREGILSKTPIFINAHHRLKQRKLMYIECELCVNHSTNGSMSELILTVTV